MKPFIYAEHAPAAPLSDHVLTYWEFDVRLDSGEQFLHHVWPDGCISLVTVRHGGALVVANVIGPGVEARRVVVEGGWSYRGIRFWPDAGGASLGVESILLRGRSVPLDGVLGGRGLELARTLAGATDLQEAAHATDLWLTRNVALPPIHAGVRNAVRRIAQSRGDIAITQLAEEANVGMRQLQRKFRSAVGLTPKEFARVRRMRSGIAAVLHGKKQWSTLAASLGYSDQSHLIRDLGEMTGFTPGGLEARLDRIEHQSVDP